MLSQEARDYLVIAVANKRIGTEIANAIDSVVTPEAAAVTPITIGTVTGVDGVGDNAADVVETQAELDAIGVKINAILTALKNANLMAV